MKSFVVGLSFCLALRLSAAQSSKCTQKSEENCTESSMREIDPSSSPYSEKRTNWTQPVWLEKTDEREHFIDIVFVVDGSSTVGEGNFSLIMEWIGNFTRDFDMTSGRFQVGLVQYSHWYRTRKIANQKDIRTEIPLGSCFNTSCLEEKLKTVKYIGHSTFTGHAIKKAVSEDFQNSKHFNHSFKFLVLVTDSTSQDMVLEPSTHARKQNITIFAVGITDAVDINELREIATGKSYENNNIYMIPNFRQLFAITQSLRNEIRSFYMLYVCPPLSLPFYGTLECSNLNVFGSRCKLSCDHSNFAVLGNEFNYCYVNWPTFVWSHKPAICGVCEEKIDLLIILDSSSSVTCPRFILAKKFVIAMIDAMRIGKDDVQVAAMRYYSEVVEEFFYDKHLSGISLKKAFRNMEYCGRGTKTGKALQHAVDHFFSPESGRRAGVPHVTLLITDGEARDDIINSSADLRKVSKVFAIGLGRASMYDIRNISSKPIAPELDRILPDYENLINVTFVRVILENFCKVSREIQSARCNVSELGSNVTCENGNDQILKRVETICHLPCAKGYNNPGRSKAVCTYEKTWQRENWECVEKNCKTPGNDDVVAKCNNSQKIGSSCVLKCRPGYEIMPPSGQASCQRGENTTISCTRTCMRIRNSEPNWDTDPIKCTKTNECRKTTCKFGQCKKQDGEVSCFCDPGYTGLLCETEIDECESRNCNNGVCHNEIGDYRCECHLGFEGRNCQINIDECTGNHCANGGICVDQVNNYKCDCRKGYGGKNCEEYINECDPNPCQNGAQCRDQIGDFECKCADGFKGALCKEEVNECETKPCDEQHTENCVDKINGFECLCRDGWTGSACHSDDDECQRDPCGIGGKTCINTVGSFSCICQSGYTGKNCQSNTDECKSSPCKNNGTCIDMVADFRCDCIKGFEGDVCAQDFDECTLPENSCSGQGQCINTIGGFYCKCNKGFKGDKCEHNIDECEHHSCKNDAQCRDRINNYSCICTPGYTGNFCQTDIDECASIPCMNNATCLNDVNKYSCTCQPGFTGMRCQIPNKSCFSNPCKNGADCIPQNSTGYRCHCLRGYEGNNCQRDKCRARPPICRNGGTCKNEKGSLKCRCAPGYFGKRCTKRPCPRLHMLSKVGQMSCNDEFLTDSKCEIICPDGYRLKFPRRNRAVNRLEMRCGKDRRWTSSEYFHGHPVQWQCEIVVCRNLDSLKTPGELRYQVITSSSDLIEEAHHINCTNGTNVGSVCSLKCHKKYIQAKVSNRKCTNVGTWTGQKWNCLPKKCKTSQILQVENAKYRCSSDSERLGSECVAVCNKGFVQYGETENRIQCNEVRNEMIWSKVETAVDRNSKSTRMTHCWKCVRNEDVSKQCDPCKIPHVRNGRYICSKGEKVGSVCTALCNSGFVVDERNSALTCDEVNGTMIWKMNGRGSICSASECDASIDLATLKTQESDYLVAIRNPYKNSRKLSSAKACDARAIYSVNVTKGDTIMTQLRYGEKVAGYHTIVSTTRNTNGRESRPAYYEHLISGFDDRLSFSGMDFEAEPKIEQKVPKEYPIRINPYTRATLTFTFDWWQWKSEEGKWKAKISHQTEVSWYTVYVGLNRIPSTEKNNDRIGNGTGLCMVCFIRN